MVEGPSGPDFGAMLSLINASKGGQGGAPSEGGTGLILGMFNGTSTPSSNLKLESAGLKLFSNVASFAAPANPGPVGKLKNSLGLKLPNIADEIAKIMKDNPLQQSPFAQASHADFGHLDNGLGGSFAAGHSGPDLGGGGFGHD
jgi:hypothetical protein